MSRAIELAIETMEHDHGGPFGAVIVRDGQIIGEGANVVLKRRDPTAHAEVEAIRDACRRLGDHRLSGCEIYASSEPCPMCLGAIYWARVDRIYFGSSRREAARAGFDDALFYGELERNPAERRVLMQQLQKEEARKAFALWKAKPNKVLY